MVKLYLPIYRDGELYGQLSFLFDLSRSSKLIFQISTTILVTLIILFILFTFTIINIARKNRKIFTVAYFDEITHLPNVRYLKRTLLQSAHQDVALIIINPLHFKFINLIYGYSYGDDLLYQIARSVESLSVKGVALQVYRFTDDQFIITVRDYDSKEVLITLCKQILAINESPGVLGSIDLTLGVVEWKERPLDFDTLIKKASIALNATSKGNRIQFYTEEIEEQILRKDTIEKELKRVIAGETDLLTLVYQPIVEAQTRSIISFEALARLQSSTLGSIPPLEFIAIAEERHLINPLGKIILEMAILFIQKLKHLGFTSFPIAINVSALQLLDDSFVEALEHSLKTSAIGAHLLEIELTESVLSHNFAFLSRQIEKIHAMGIQIAIDDFGTGFSSLNRLRGLVVDTLKLDKQFIDKLPKSDDTGISSDIISMAHHLGKKIIAEGVETEEQREILIDMHCDYMQGYLFSRPVAEEEVITLLKQERGGN